MKIMHRKNKNRRYRRLSSQFLAGTLSLGVCSGGIAPTLAASLTSTTRQGYLNSPIAIGDDCLETSSFSRKNSFTQSVFPTAVETLFLENCNNSTFTEFASSTLQSYIDELVASDDDCREELPPTTTEASENATKEVSLLKQKTQVANPAVQNVSLSTNADANSLISDQQINDSLLISQEADDLCEVGSGDDLCDIGGGEVLCEVGGEPPAIGGGEIPPLLAAGGAGPSLAPLLGLLTIPVLAGNRGETPPGIPPTPPGIPPTPPGETPPGIPPTPPGETPPGIPPTPPGETPPGIPPTPPGETPPGIPPTPPIEPIPEPSEILGTLVALGLGIFTKRKYSRKKS